MVRNALTLVGLIFGLLLSYVVEMPIVGSSWASYQVLGLVLVTAVVFAGIVWAMAPLLIRGFRAFTSWLEGRVARLTRAELLWGAIGLILGLVAGYLLAIPLSVMPLIGHFTPIVVSVLLGYVGLIIGIKVMPSKDALEGLGSIVRRERRETKTAGPVLEAHSPKILDTSVIIDGRIADILKTGFLEGTIVVPAFVLEELRHIADSADVLKRNRGRRGLDILNRIQKELDIPVQIMEKDFGTQVEVDSKLLRLAKALDGKVVTNDYNLNKVAALHDVPVLNINELANAVKPVVLPGEEMAVAVVKDGKEPGQGVAYLDDGTMIVVDGGRRFIGETVDVLVTSVLQTAAGRMIFAKPKTAEGGTKALSQN